MRRMNPRCPALASASRILLVLAVACAPVASGEDVEPELILAYVPVGGWGCAVDADCDDRIACTIDHCESGACEHSPCVDCCPDGLECIVGFGCGHAPLPCETDEECGDDTPCTLDRCRDGDHCEHLPQDDLCDEGEICLAALGCIPAPPSECETDEDCEMAPCLGVWYCDPEFACQFESVVDCDDADPCTDDLCDPEIGECVHPVHDGDGDGFGDAGCGGEDCDDADPDRHPEADEECNGVDDDCDGDVDEGCCEAGEDCVTECGTTGETSCNPDGTEGPCVPPPESCNGIDDDCDGDVDEDPSYECSPAGAVGDCPTSCGSTGTRTCLAGSCTWDLCVPPAEVCNGVDDDCDTTCDEGHTCCAGRDRDCSALGFYAGTATCLADCSGFDTSGCHDCGNGTVDAGEDCDGSVPSGTDCTTLGLGFGGGTLACTSGCRFDTSGCHDCGNGVVDAGEDCDGSVPGGTDCTTLGLGFTGGSLACSGSCEWDTSGCTVYDPSGTFTVSPPPTYSCAYQPLLGIYLVNLFISTMTFVDASGTLSVTGAPCLMSGPSAETTRVIDVSCVIPGGCDETYSLSATFTDDDHWSGTFTAAYTIGSGGGGCADCTTHSWSVTGSRVP